MEVVDNTLDLLDGQVAAGLPTRPVSFTALELTHRQDRGSNAEVQEASIGH